MKKARNPKKQSISRLKKKCDQLWGQIIRSAGACEHCGAADRQLHAHHLIRRDCIRYRHDPMNGVCLCSQCHTYGMRFSAHGTPWLFEDWLNECKPDQFIWFCNNRNQISPGYKPDYQAILDDLSEVVHFEKTFQWTKRKVGIE